MSEQADVAIVGAGILGLSVGFHLLLRQRSLRVVVVEQAPVAGAGSTGKATGGIRHQFSSEALIGLSKKSIEEYRNFESLTGVTSEFEDVGYLLFATTDAAAGKLREGAIVQRACGVVLEELDAEEISRRWPYLNSADIRRGIYTPGDGHADPHAATTGYLQAYRRLGGRILFDEQVTGIRTEADRVSGVQTIRRVIEAPAVVNAGGVRAAEIARSVNVDLPVRSYRRQIAVVAPIALGVDRIPFTMEVDSGWYLHRQRDGVILLGGIDKNTHPGVEEIVDPQVTERLLEIGMKRVPLLAQANLIRSYTGLRALTPDDLPILGPVPTPRGLFCACGFAGHGFMHAPAAGDALAQWILGRRPDISGLEVFLPERFVRTASSGHNSGPEWLR